MQEKFQKLLEQAYELCEDGNYVRALEYYDMALDIEPDNLNVMVDKGVTLQNLGRFNEALQMYEKALSIEAENLDALINKGSVLHILKKYSKAIFCYDAVLDHYKRNAMALAYKGLSIGEMGNIPSAIKYFKKALCMEKDYDLAQISLLTAKNILKNTS